MPNKYCNLDGGKLIKDEYPKINTGFDRVSDDMIGVNKRVNNIITTPVDSISAQEIIDARGGKEVLNDRFNEIGLQLEQKAEQINTLDAKIKFKGVLIRNIATQSIPNDVFTHLVYNNTIRNTGGFVIGSDRITIPAGVSKVKIRANLAWATNGSGNRRLTVYKNGVNESRLGRDTRIATSDIATEIAFGSIIDEVTEGDYYQMAVYQNSGGSLGVSSYTSHFEIEVVE